MSWKKLAPYIFILFLLCIALWLRNRDADVEIQTEHQTTQTNIRGLNRNPQQISYSKHARCRMDCRKVSEKEVEELLKDGTINYKKSDLKGEPCQKKYAVEGISRDNQKLRIIFAPCADEVTVVTVIDLQTEWECDCE